jgi:isoquinoline 1-oxidoreductase beta subunit
VEVLVSKSEMGQGIATGFATVVAEELGARLDQIDVVFPVADESFDDPVAHTLLTGGSFSMHNMYPSLRLAGAAARATLIAAAAQQWGVGADRCTADGGMVRAPGGRSATYGSLAGAAAKLPVPNSVAYKDPAHYTYVGKHLPRLDIPAKVDGSAAFGIDAVLPGMRYATVIHPPCMGAKLGSFDAAAAREVPGVRDVFAITGAVAVVADNTWSAFQGARALTIAWDEPARKPSSATLAADAAALAADPKRRKTAKSVGDASIRGAKSIAASYTGPFVAHAAMEPMNATASVANGTCVVHAPMQAQSAARAMAAKAAGVSIDAVELHTTYIGGGFGRRLHSDFVREAVEIAKHHGTPVKLTWTREEDFQHDYYRPMFHSDVRGELDGAGRLIALDQTVVAPSALRISVPEFSGGKVDGEFIAGVRANWGLVSSLYLRGFDGENVQGADDSPYDIRNLLVSYVEHDAGVPVGDLRAPGSNWNSFVLETFLDECAHAGGRDGLALRRELLAASPRSSAVLERVVVLSGYATHPAPPGHALGLAFATWMGSMSAIVADVSVAGTTPRVHRLWIAADVGRAINPDNIAAQLEGGALFGLSMAQAGKITLADGRVQQSNFADYAVLRMADAPSVQTAVIDSGAEPTGVGELGVPAVAPAVANAIFALTGKRIRSLPFTDALA